jgi:hypothetical protein
MTVHRTVTLWKNLGMRCLLVPRNQAGSDSFEVQLIRGQHILDVRVVADVDAAYPIAQRWQLENRSQRDSTAIAA